MKKSARILGQDFGLTAQEMNFVLKEEGYLQGEPGNYSVTEKGQQFADEQYHHRGTGGYSHYNRSWETRTWDDCITDNLDITVKKKREIQQAIFLAKKRQKEDLDCILPGVDKNFDTTDSGYEYCENQDDNGVLVDAGSIFLILVSSYGIYKAAPFIKRWWLEKALPGFKKINEVLDKEQD